MTPLVDAIYLLSRNVGWEIANLLMDFNKYELLYHMMLFISLDRTVGKIN